MLRTELTALARAALVATAAFFLLGVGQAAKDADELERSRALLVARGLAFAASREIADAAAPRAQELAARLPAALPGLRRALVLDGVKLRAHTDPALAGTRLDRESVADKALYDLSGRLRSLAASNTEERAKDPALTRDPYAEVLAAEKDGARVVTVPVKVEGEVRAIAHVELAELGTPRRWPWMLLAACAGAILLQLGVALTVRRRGVAIATGGVLLAALLASDALLLERWRDGARDQGRAVEAEVIGALVKAGIVESGDPVSALALGATGERRVDLASVARDGAVSWTPEALVAAREVDRRNLTIWAVSFGALAVLGFVLGVLGQIARARRLLAEHRIAYLYISPAAVGLLVLVFIPVAFGLVLGFMRRRYNVFEFAGLANYASILSDLHVSDPQNFYFKLGVTVLWTVLNVSLHVGIGLTLALLLNDSMLKARGVYRVLLIVPWAIPNYITALIWKGMFHKQFGAVNAFLAAVGIEPIAWFQTFWPAFSTNVITNAWLGFPFMMLISLGALQSIPADLYEAARVDGAKRWQRFRFITLPLLMPALVPAVIVGVVWTFNMFNIIYLVSGGAPNGATDILITDAFRWAFERDDYGYAAAYSTLIFLILLAFSLATNRITGATRGVFE